MPKAEHPVVYWLAVVANSDHFNTQESDITGKQSDRSHEQRLDLLDQELLVVQKTVRSQRDIFERLERYSQQSAYRMPAAARSRAAPIQGPSHPVYYSGAPRGAQSVPHMHRQYNHYEQSQVRSAHGYGQQGQGQYYEPPPFYDEEVTGSMAVESKQLSARDPGGFRQLFLNECILQLDQREREFEEYELHSKQLRVMVWFLSLSLISDVLSPSTDKLRSRIVTKWTSRRTAKNVSYMPSR